MYKKYTSASWLTIAVVAVVIAFSGCQSEEQGEHAAPTRPRSSVAAAPSMPVPPPRSAKPTRSPTPLPTASPSRSASLPIETVPPTPAPSVGNIRTFVGIAYEGPEPGCVGLRVGAVSYELTGPSVGTLLPGDLGRPLGRVRVVGRFAPPSLASHCMIGRIFEVTTLTKL